MCASPPRPSATRTTTASISNLKNATQPGLHFSANYTWSKLIDDLEARSELGGSFGNIAFSNFFDRAADRGLGGNHIAHRFIWSSVYELPFRSTRGALNHIIGGWSLGMIAEFRSGSPFGVLENNAAGVVRFAPTVRSDAVAPYSANSAWRDNVLGETFFDAAAFARPQRGRFGNLGRTVAIGPGAAIVDLSILKDISFCDRHRPTISGRDAEHAEPPQLQSSRATPRPRQFRARQQPDPRQSSPHYPARPAL